MVLDFYGHTGYIVELFEVRHLLSALRQNEGCRVLYGPCLIKFMDVRKLLFEFLPVVAEISQRVLTNLCDLLKGICLENAHHLVCAVRRVLTITTTIFCATNVFAHFYQK